ncbi:MAG TPA: glycosyltransferase family 2 protein [Pyrinomonadaceae bacterium]|nr:glycosyltransferase family 2 protein [Pyrinomonadaceae bacterium]
MNQADTLPVTLKHALSGEKLQEGGYLSSHMLMRSVKNVTVVIPAYNEELAVGQTVTDIRESFSPYPIDLEIIVVDDGSKDATAPMAHAAGARVIQHRSNRGYGASLKTGITAATHKMIAITDADGTYPARYLPQMLAELENADMVVGSRTGQDVHIPLTRRPAKWILACFANYVSNTRIPDLNSGLRVFRRDAAMQYFPILSDQFSFTTTITLAMLCDKYAVTYIPIDYARRRGRSKIVPWDAGSFAILILRMAMLFRPLRVFLPLGLIALSYGLVKMGIDLARDPNISASAILSFVTALLLVLLGMLADAISTRLGRLNQAVIGVQPKEFIEFESEAADEIVFLKQAKS